MRPIAAGLALAILLASGFALAQTSPQPAPQAGPPPARQACRASALSLCKSEALSGDRAAVRACLIRNFDKVSPDCQAAMKAMQARMSAQPQGAPPKP